MLEWRGVYNINDLRLVEKKQTWGKDKFGNLGGLSRMEFLFNSQYGANKVEFVAMHAFSLYICSFSRASLSAVPKW